MVFPADLHHLLPRLVWAARPLGRRAPASAWAPTLPQARRVDLPGRGACTVRYVAGPPDAVPVLLMHGVTWSGAINFHGLVNELAERHPVVMMDHRGHGSGLPSTGRTEMADLADDAVAVLDALGIERAILAGFSLGSLTALHVALRAPDRVAGLVLSGGALVVRSHALERAVVPVGVAGLSVLAAAGVGRSIPARYLGLTRRVGGPEFAEVWPWLRAELARTHPSAFLRAIAAATRHDLRGKVAPLRGVPSVVVVHDRDTLIPARLQHEMCTEIGADKVVLDADHDAPLADPTAYRDAMLEAVARIDAVRGTTRLRRTAV